MSPTTVESEPAETSKRAAISTFLNSQFEALTNLTDPTLLHRLDREELLGGVKAELDNLNKIFEREVEEYLIKLEARNSNFGEFQIIEEKIPDGFDLAYTIQILKSNTVDRQLCHIAAFELVLVGEFIAPAVEELLFLRNNQNLAVASFIYAALGKVSSAADKIVPVLCEDLESRAHLNTDTERHILSTIKGLGGAASAALPILLKSMNDDRDERNKNELAETVAAVCSKDLALVDEGISALEAHFPAPQNSSIKNLISSLYGARMTLNQERLKREKSSKR